MNCLNLIWWHAFGNQAFSHSTDVHIQRSVMLSERTLQNGLIEERFGQYFILMLNERAQQFKLNGRELDIRLLWLALNRNRLRVLIERKYMIC